MTNIRLQFISVLVGTVLLGFKFLAYFLTQSNTILTDALESITNVVAGGLGLYSLMVAAIPKDRNHPYGHGKIEFISAGVEGTLIGLAGGAIILKSIYSLFYPNEVQSLDLGLYITAAAGAVNYLLGHWAETQGKKSNSLALMASGKHLKSDAYSTIGLICGLGLIMLTGWAWLDSVVAIVFGFIILWAGLGLVKESVSAIMDEADYFLIKKIVHILQNNRKSNWIDVHNLRVIKYGNALHVDCHLTVPRYFEVTEAHEEVDLLEEALEANLDAPVEVFVHVDACTPASCGLCQRANCPIRQSEFIALQAWTLENIMKNKKHEAGGSELVRIE